MPIAKTKKAEAFPCPLCGAECLPDKTGRKWCDECLERVIALAAHRDAEGAALVLRAVYAHAKDP